MKEKKKCFEKKLWHINYPKEAKLRRERRGEEKIRRKKMKL